MPALNDYDNIGKSKERREERQREKSKVVDRQRD